MTMKKILVLAVMFSIHTTQALAIPIRVVYSQDIDSSSVELKIAKGYGLTLDFMATGETIKQVWIGDPSRFAFTSNGNLCPLGSERNCEGGKATVLFIRQIKPISFPNVTNSSDGSTQITVLTNQKQYQFKLVAVSGKPSYTSLIIKPESEKPEPMLRNIPLSPVPTNTPQLTTVSQPRTLESVKSPQLTIVSQPRTLESVKSPQLTIVSRTAKSVGTSLQRNDANALAYGLLIAKYKGQIRQNSPKWNQIQTAIALLRKGKSRRDSARISGTKISVIEQLIKWGQI
jgi:hypothetical protein